MSQHPGPPALPAPLRAALGVIATVADALQDGRGIPDKVLELPVLAVSSALAFSLRAQQQYAALTVRGDQLLSQLRGGPSDDPPPWAEFDDDPPVPHAAPEGSDEVSDPPPAEPTTSRKTAKKAPTKRPAASKAAKKTPVTKSAATVKVSTPRTGKPSAFDLVGD